MKIAILGFARDGQAAYDYFNQPDNELEIRDQNENIDLPPGAKARLGPDYLKGLESFDLIVRTAGLLPTLIAKNNSPDILSKVTGNIDEFYKASPTKNIIGVTGTKGKGTTSTLIAKMLKAAGKQVHLGGNIGLPALGLLKNGIKPDDWVVLEQSSFQLIDQKHSPRIAVCLMVVPEHLDMHSNIDEYFTAKQHLFAHQSAEDIAIYYADNEISTKIASISPGQKIPYMKPPGAYVENDEIKIANQAICKTGELKLLGKHNWQNVCAAVTTVWQINQGVEAIRSVITTFAGLEHRLEFVREVDKVKYYNDSFASAPPAPIAAMEAIAGKKVIICGGFDRGLELKEFIEKLNSQSHNLRKVLLIGASAKRLADELTKSSFTNFEILSDKDMPSIVTKAKLFAQPGDSVVLSPGFPSFDMFTNFEERGQKFKAAVRDLS